jgi:hypothetical protein
MRKVAEETRQSRIPDVPIRAYEAALQQTGWNLNEANARLAERGTRVRDQIPGVPPRPLVDDFIEPPFSVLDARSDRWQEHKRRWLAFGINSDLGRAGALTYGRFDQAYVSEPARERYGEGSTSTFDPVLAELMYRWYAPRGGEVLDPFAGGSVRGIVAAKLGLSYLGIELRAEQVEANRAQGAAILGADITAAWVHGDSLTTLRGLDGVPPDNDFILTSPPYGSLEIYSDDPRDLSMMRADEFEEAYYEILWLAGERLREDRFAVIVVGNVRDRSGHLRDLVGLTRMAMYEAGGALYNECVLVTPVGTAAIRARKQFENSRKAVTVHQSVLCFVKGDARRATAAVASSGELAVVA